MIDRRRFLYIAGVALLSRQQGLGQAAYQGTAYRSYSRCLPDYLRTLALEAYERRNSAIRGLTNPAEIRARQKWARETFWRLSGGEPERTPLEPKVASSFERDGYRVDNVIYSSRPGLLIPANLYIPTRGTPPYPGILFQLGHSLNGKASGLYQKCCQGLARLGYVVLAFDTMGQGERTYYPAAGSTLTRLGSADTEHTLPGQQMLLFGDTSTRMQTWDAVRSLDYLASLPMVDTKRLGTTGNSGGGTVSMMLACVDDRIAAAAISCPNTENFACAGFNPPGSTDDAEQNFVDGGPAGFDRWDMLYPLAPKPLLVLVSARDFFGTYSPSYISSGWEEFQKLQGTYRTLDSASNIEWADTPLPHGLAYQLRLRIYDFFGRRFKNERVTEEPRVEPEKDERLWVSPGGNVVRSLGSKTPFALNQRQVKRASRDLRELLRVDDVRTEFVVKGMAHGSAPVNIEAVELKISDSVWLPAWIFRPSKESEVKRALLMIEPQGRNTRWQEDGLYQNLAAQGYLICAADVRGAGDLLPEHGSGAQHYSRPHSEEQHWAWASLMLGKPLAGQRTTDIVALARALTKHCGLASVTVCASGKMTVPALFAAAIEPSVEGLYLSGPLLSFQNVIETEEYTHVFANFVPRLLLHTDLPEIAASLAPRRLTLAGVVNASGGAVPVDLVRQRYPGDHIMITPGSRWDEQELLG